MKKQSTTAVVTPPKTREMGVSKKSSENAIMRYDVEIMEDLGLPLPVTNDEIVGYVYRTPHLEKFTLIEGNREIKKNKVLEESITSYGIIAPVIVNTDLDLCDGQTRRQIAIDLKLPDIEYIVKDIDLEHIQNMQCGKDWLMVVRANSYRKSLKPPYNEAYERYYQFSTKYGLGHNMNLAWLTGAYSNRVDNNTFKMGKLKVTKDQYERAIDEVEKLMEIVGAEFTEDGKMKKAQFHKNWKRRPFILAYFNLLKRVKNFSHKQMVRNLHTHSDRLLQLSSVKGYVQNLVEIHNWHLRGPKAVYSEMELIDRGI